MAIEESGVGTELRLTEWTSCGGCAAKWGATMLAELVCDFPVSSDPSLLVGLAPFDDAAIYQVSPDVAMVSTTDFFPPLVDDPADFGAIAAANACSDVFAMGGRVTHALNIAAFPEEFPREAIAAIFAAAAGVVADAGGSIVGGHTIRNPEPIFGLSVHGLVHPNRVFRKSGARPGDEVLLSKPVGTGLCTAGKDPAAIAAAVAGMRTLNRSAAEQLAELGAAVHAVTDVTGYGLAGHAWEVAERSGVGVSIDSAGLVTYHGAREAATAGVRTGGDPRNRDYVGANLNTDFDRDVPELALCFDPQTSGGLLAVVDPAAAADLTGAPTGGPGTWWRVGRIDDSPPRITVV